MGGSPGGGGCSNQCTQQVGGSSWWLTNLGAKYLGGLNQPLENFQNVIKRLTLNVCKTGVKKKESLFPADGGDFKSIVKRTICVCKHQVTHSKQQMQGGIAAHII